MTYACPVCDYDRLDRPPIDHSICPRCGTEFGYDDDLLGLSHAELRAAWIEAGRPWWSTARPEPGPRVSDVAGGR